VPFMACYRVNFTPFTIDAVDRAQTLAVAVWFTPINFAFQIILDAN
jgi:hypothetical protein